MSLWHRVGLTIGLMAMAVVRSSAEDLCPSFVQRWGGPSNSMVVAIKDQYTFFSSRGKLMVADTSDLNTPILVAEMPLPGDPVDYEVSPSQQLLFAVVNGELHVIDISEPSVPAVACTYSATSWSDGSEVTDRIADVEVVGEHLYLGTAGSLEVIDTTTPEALVEIASCDIEDGVVSVSVQGDDAWLTFSDGVQLVDVSDLHDPRPGPLYLFDDTLDDLWIEARSGAVAGSYLYLTVKSWDGTGMLLVFDVSDTELLTLIRRYSLDDPHSARTIDGAVYVADGTGIIQLKNGRSTWQINTPGQAHAIVISSDIAAVADGTGLQLVDTEVPIRLAGSWRSPEADRPTGLIVVDEGMVVVIDSGDRALLLSITEPSQPVVRATIESSAKITAMAADGHYLYMATELGELSIIDIAEPELPRTIGSLNLTQITSLTPFSSHLLAAAGTDIVTVDLTDPATPLVVGHLPLEASVSDIEVYGRHLYASVSWTGLVILDLSNPATLVEVGRLPIELPDQLAVSAGRAYVLSLGWGAMNLQVIDVSDPAQPELISVIRGQDEVYSFATVGTMVAVVQTTYGNLWEPHVDPALAIVDASDPDVPVQVGNLKAGVLLHHTVELVGALLLCTGHQGVQLYELSSCSSGELQPDFGWWPESPQEGDRVRFYDTTSGFPMQWQWDFGDGVTLSEQQPSHVFTTLPARVWLTVSNAQGSRTISKGIPAVSPYRRLRRPGQ